MVFFSSQFYLFLFFFYWTLSSVGRASRLHRGGQRFEPFSVHHKYTMHSSCTSTARFFFEHVLYAHLSKKTFVSAQYERIVYLWYVWCSFCISTARFFLNMCCMHTYQKKLLFLRNMSALCISGMFGSYFVFQLQDFF